MKTRASWTGKDQLTAYCWLPVIRLLAQPLRIALLAAFLQGACSGHALAENDIRDSIVKIYTVQIRPDYDNPWRMKSPSSSYGSGTVIHGRRILTNAHLVSDQTFVQVRLHGRPKKVEAHVIAVSHEADLALLTVDDPSFLEGIKPLLLGELPEVQQQLMVYGFPEGGDTLSATQGVVSRVEHHTYVHGVTHLLAVQLDAAINPGNSGGPVIVNDSIAGVAMQTFTEAENVGYMVPIPVIKHFLKDLEDGRYDGIPDLGVVCQDMENVALRKMYGLEPKQSGSLVTVVIPGMPAHGLLEPGDVILSVDGHDVADDGTVELRPKERTSMDHYVQQHQIGEKVTAEILRNGQRMELRITLTKQIGSGLLVPWSRYDVRPTYFIYGGLVFSPLTYDYLSLYGDPPEYLFAFLDEPRRVESEEVVVLSRVLAAEVNNGYHDFEDWHITEVNGKRIHNLRDLVGIVENDTQDPYTIFRNHQGLVIVLDRARAETEQAAILKTYRIPSDRSEDLR